MNELGLKLTELLNSGVDLLSTEIPAFVGELLTYKTIEYSVFLVLSIMVLVAGKKLGSKCAKAFRDDEENVPVIMATGIGTVAAFAVGFIMAIDNGVNLLQITIAPRVWLLEYAKDLMG